LFKFSDRKETDFLLAPTHEEEITTLVARTVKSYKELPLRLYQITRKYRDELRPRHGLLRGREFIMKDLYTFDISAESASDTYHTVRAAYAALFAEMKLPVLAARASSGDMGGALSHEYLLPIAIGDDHVVHCNKCDYVVNEEIAGSSAAWGSPADDELGVWRGITKDRLTLVNVWYPKRLIVAGSEETRENTDADIDLHSVKSIVPALDTAVVDAVPLWAAAMANSPLQTMRLLNLADGRLPSSVRQDLVQGKQGAEMWPIQLHGMPLPPLLVSDSIERDFPGAGLLRVRDGDDCPRCSSGTLKVERALELGHTFDLGTRYSEPLGLAVAVPPATKKEPVFMGCHGIGISRIIGAVAEHLADGAGLNWPVAIAPYSCVVVPGKEEDMEGAIRVHDHVVSSAEAGSNLLDVVVDDRRMSLPWKLRDADLIGFPVMIILGRGWRASQCVEVQCRQLKLREDVEWDRLPGFINKLYRRL
jgi:prolyl-tRNA synthetase